MPALDNARHERFCQEVAKGQAAGKAYVVAGYSEKAATVEPYRLLENPRVRERIRELQNTLVEETGYTQQRIAKMLEEDREFARANGQASAATAATVALGKLHGHFVEKHEHKVTVAHEERMRHVVDVIAEHRHAEVTHVTQ